MELKNLGKKSRHYWLTKNIVWLILICVPFTVARFFTENQAQLILTIVGGITIGVSAILLVLFPFLKFSFYKYGYNEERIIIHRGVIFRHRIVIPVCQIQDLHIFEGPIMSMFGLSGIIFSTAGSNFALPCIDKAAAEAALTEIEAYLNARIKELENETV